MSRAVAAIIGGGVIGGGWAARFALNGWDVRVFDPDPEAERRIGEVMENARWALPMLYDAALPEEGGVSFCASVAEAVGPASWVQESVGERLELKHAVIAEIQAARPDVPVGSSTSGFMPSELQRGAPAAARIMVAHPFNPVYLLPLVEIVPSEATDPAEAERACATLESIGMHPLRVRREIPAHIADRMLEAIWREALWMVRDGIATTAEIDDAIRFGFGLRFAQMGMFETYRIAGGEQGVRHFLAQFGPALQWPWSRLTDVPDLDDDLIETIAAQSDAQSGGESIRGLERRRDANLVAMIRALAQRGDAAGALARRHGRSLREAPQEACPVISQRRVVPIDWTDMNGHMNEGRYGQIFSDAAEEIMEMVGADAAYVAGGMSYFTVETAIKYLAETHAGERVEVRTRVCEGRGKLLRCAHEMVRAADGEILATCDQTMLHVSLETRRTCEPAESVRARVERLAALHAEG